MKKTKKLALGLGALLMSLTAASGVTGTLAWFTAANTVTVTGLNMQAAAEEGIVISNSDKNTWTTSATAKVNPGDAAFIPTSTADLSTWYHALSNSATDGQSGLSYETFTINEPTIEGVKSGTAGDQVTAAKNVYLLNDFYIQAAGVYEINTQDIYIQNLSATVDGTSVSDDLNKSLRLGIMYYDVINENTTNTIKTIFSPVDGATARYTVNKTTEVTPITKTTTSNSTTALVATSVKIPAYTPNGATALKFSTYLWFEGEDKENKSVNITANLDKLAISFKFGNKDHTTTNP